MPIITIADLFEHGFDAEVESLLRGNVTPGATVEGLAFRSFGSEWQGNLSTLIDFVGRVRESMTAADALGDQGLPPGFVVPEAIGRPTDQPFSTIGFASSDAQGNENAQAPNRLHLPFSIDSAEIPTPGDILQIIRDNPDVAVRSLATESPGLIKRLEELELERLVGVERDWEVSVTRIWRNIQNKIG